MNHPSHPRPPLAEWSLLASDFGEFAELISPHTAAPTPGQLVNAAQLATPHADAIGLTLIPDRGRPRSLATTAPLAQRIDDLQYLHHEGPCLDAAEGDDVVRVDDLAQDTRWPLFGPAVVHELAMHSILSLRLHLSSSSRAALNFYAARPAALGDSDLAPAAIFASFVGLAVDAAQARAQAADLQVALGSSRQIGTAIGILMARGLLTSEQAFEQLRTASQRLNRKLRDVADDVVTTGVLPAADIPPRREPRSGGSSGS